MFGLLLALMFYNFLPLSEGKIGYDINAVVSNSTATSSWSRSQSTEIMKFQYDSACTGNGRSAKYMTIDGFAGIGLKDNTYTGEGRFICSENIELMSDENYIFIEETGENNSEHYTCKINESLPTLLSVKNKVFYTGDEIRARNAYKNNEDRIYTSYHAKSFTKSATYLGFYDKALITADVTPTCASVYVMKDSVTSFSLFSTSDLYSGLRFMSGKDGLIDDDYLGPFTINQRIAKRYSFDNQSEEVDWLECCPSDSDEVKFQTLEVEFEDVFSNLHKT